MWVATKELKNRLSHYLRLVRAGERVQVTDRGQVVAEIRATRGPASGEDEILSRLEGEGLVTVGGGRIADHKPLRVKRGAHLSRMVIEDRG
jgi:antitoxin (DNA-binding transcriptional repressor) of toxin-antitoxin stability system